MFETSERSGDELVPLAKSFHELYKKAAERYPHRRAIACLHQPADLLCRLSGCSTTDGPYLRWTHEELARASHSFARKLFSAGLRPGMRIVTLMSAGIEWHVILHASLELGCIFSVLNQNLADHTRELNHMFSVVEPAMIVAQRPALAAKISSTARERTESTKLRLIIEQDVKGKRVDGWQGFIDFAERNSTAASDGSFDDLNIQREPEDVIALYATSGTTSLPKGCPLTNRALVSQASSFIQLNKYTKERVSLLHLPLNHSKSHSDVAAVRTCS